MGGCPEAERRRGMWEGGFGPCMRGVRAGEGRSNKGRGWGDGFWGGGEEGWSGAGK